MGKYNRVLETQGTYVTTPYSSAHRAVDLGWHDNAYDNILAHSEGVVVFCQTGIPNDKGSSGNRSYGNCVKIKHPNGYYTLYAHLSSVAVSYGQTVKTGQIIGKMGNTGNSYGNHLHWEVRDRYDDRINPTNYVNGDLPNLPTKKEEPKKEEEEITQAQFNEMLNNWLLAQAKREPGAWSAQARDWAEFMGYIQGDEKGNKMYKKPLSREEFAAVLYRFAKKEGLQ